MPVIIVIINVILRFGRVFNHQSWPGTSPDSFDSDLNPDQTRLLLSLVLKQREAIFPPKEAQIESAAAAAAAGKGYCISLLSVLCKSALRECAFGFTSNFRGSLA